MRRRKKSPARCIGRKRRRRPQSSASERQGRTMQGFQGRVARDLSGTRSDDVIEQPRWGALPMPGGGTRFRLWAPQAERVMVQIEGEDSPEPLSRTEGGWHELTTRRAGVGSRYQYVLADGTRVPDPASRFQPQDVQGPSEVIDPRRFRWSDESWRGRPWHEAVVYELHVGAFTPAGTFRAAQEKLAYLADLGVTAIELMPIGDFPGARN